MSKLYGSCKIKQPQKRGQKQIQNFWPYLKTSRTTKSFAFRNFKKFTYSRCSPEDKQKIFHTRKQLMQPLQVLLGACSWSHLVLLLRLECQCLQLFFSHIKSESHIQLIAQCSIHWYKRWTWVYMWHKKEIRSIKWSSPGWTPGWAPCCRADAARPLSGGMIGALHVGQVCWRSSHDLKQCTWNRCPQSSFFAVVISSRQIIHVASLLNTR